jgi:hypothetical protein
LTASGSARSVSFEPGGRTLMKSPWRSKQGLFSGWRL